MSETKKGHVYEVVKDANGFVLHKDGRATTCLFQPAIITQGATMGSMNIMRLPCTTQCPHARIVSAVGEEQCDTYIISCTSIGQNFPLSVQNKEEAGSAPMSIIR